MTVLFDIRGAQWPIDREGCAQLPAPMYLQISNRNARDFFDWIGLDNAELFGEVHARELAAILRRRLWPEQKHVGDIGLPTRVLERSSNATIVDLGRPAGRLAEYAERLLRLAEYADNGVIVWG